MVQSFPLEYVLSNGTHVLVREPEAGVYELHLTRLNSMKHNFTWTPAGGISNAEAATGIGSDAFSGEEEEAVALLQQHLDTMMSGE